MTKSIPVPTFSITLKAIRVKFLSPTNTLPARLKASAGSTKAHLCSVYPLSYVQKIVDMTNRKRTKEEVTAELFLSEQGWTEDYEISGQGMFDNCTYFTIQPKERTQS